MKEFIKVERLSDWAKIEVHYTQVYFVGLVSYAFGFELVETREQIIKMICDIK